MKLSKTLIAAMIAACHSPLALAAQSEDFARKSGKGGDPAERRARIQQMDANGDGVISRDEAESSGNPERAQRMFDHLDSDGDGNITREEMRAGGKRFSEQAGQKGPSGKKGGRPTCSSCQN
jgi:Ca2+-binding EF-hand superfamily protein